MSGMAECLCQMLTWSRCGKSLSDLLKGPIIAGEGNYTKGLSLTHEQTTTPVPIKTQTNSQVKVSSPTPITTVKMFKMILLPLVGNIILVTRWSEEAVFLFCRTNGKLIVLKREDSTLHYISPSLHVSL